MKSFFDYDTSMIGPYKIPMELGYNPILSQGTKGYEYMLYKLVNNSKSMLAAFLANNTYIICLDQFGFHERKLDGLYNEKLLHVRFPQPMQIPNVRHVGYWKTYTHCLSISELPWHMFLDMETGTVCGTNGLKIPYATFDPDICIYKELITKDESIQGVFFDMNEVRLRYIEEHDGNFTLSE